MLSLYITRTLGSDVYGLFTLGIGLLMIFSTIGRFGLDITITRYLSAAATLDKQMSSVFDRALLVTLVFSGILSVLLILFRNTIAVYLFDKPNFAEYIFWVALSVPVWSTALVYTGLFRGLKLNTIFSITKVFARLFLTFILVFICVQFFELRIDALPLILHFVAMAAILVICYIYTRLKIDFQQAIINMAIPLKKMVRESAPVLFASLFLVLFLWVDRLIIGVYRDESEVAIYDIVVRLALLVSFSGEGINAILGPLVSKSYASGDLKGAQGNIRFSVALGTLLSFLVFLFLVVCSKYILNMFGDQFVSGYYALLLLGLSQLLSSIIGPFANILQMIGRQREVQRILFLGVVLTILCCFVLIPSYGLMGAAISTFIGRLVTDVLGCYRIYRKLGFVTVFNPLKLLYQN